MFADYTLAEARQLILSQWLQMDKSQRQSLVRRIERAIQQEHPSLASFEVARSHRTMANELDEKDGIHPEDWGHYLRHSRLAYLGFNQSRTLASARMKAWNLVARTKESLRSDEPGGKRRTEAQAIAAAKVRRDDENASINHAAGKVTEALSCLQEGLREAQKFYDVVTFSSVPLENNKRKIPEHWANALQPEVKRAKTTTIDEWEKQSETPDIPGKFKISGKGNGGWTFERILKPRNAENALSLWVQKSHDAIIDVSTNSGLSHPTLTIRVQRLVMKENFLSDNEWHNVNTWVNVRFDSDDDARVPRELESQRLSSASRSPDNVVELRSTLSRTIEEWVDRPTKSYRVFMNYCKNQVEVLLLEH